MNFIALEEKHYSMLAEYYAETYNAPPWNDHWTEKSALEHICEMMDCRGAFGLICLDDRENFAGAILGSTETYYNVKQFFVKDFFVPPVLQGQGTGSRLLAELERQLGVLGVRKIYLITAKEERTEGYYQSRGFKRWDNMILMGKDL